MLARLILISLIALIGLTACGKSEKELKAEVEAQQRIELRKPVLAQLKDPDSATFRNEFLRPGNALCGEYNSKNGMGGYAGYTRFIVSKGNFVDLESSGLFPIDKNENWTLRANLEEISRGYDALIAEQKRSLSLPVANKEPEPTGFEKRWAEYCG